MQTQLEGERSASATAAEHAAAEHTVVAAQLQAARGELDTATNEVESLQNNLQQKDRACSELERENGQALSLVESLQSECASLQVGYRSIMSFTMLKEAGACRQLMNLQASWKSMVNSYLYAESGGVAVPVDSPRGGGGGVFRNTKVSNCKVLCKPLDSQARG